MPIVCVVGAAFAWMWWNRKDSDNEDDEINDKEEPLLLTNNDDRIHADGNDDTKIDHEHNSAENNRTCLHSCCCWKKSKKIEETEEEESTDFDDDISTFQPLSSIAESSNGSFVPIMKQSRIIPKLPVQSSIDDINDGVELGDDYESNPIRKSLVQPFKPRSQQRHLL